MTPHAEAFVAALIALCRQYQLDLYISGDDDGPQFGIAPLAPGEEPLRYAMWEEETTAPPPPPSPAIARERQQRQAILDEEEAPEGKGEQRGGE